MDFFPEVMRWFFGLLLFLNALYLKTVLRRLRRREVPRSEALIQLTEAVGYVLMFGGLLFWTHIAAVVVTGLGWLLVAAYFVTRGLQRLKRRRAASTPL
ncbi:hypothetical protein [Streptomyces sp. NPDC060194]|uniref:hypothetical protein n=1 Tax=Streptomyces sp. NPDC060194 TaxID=3347069 RepID=UPI003666BE9A